MSKDDTFYLDLDEPIKSLSEVLNCIDNQIVAPYEVHKEIVLKYIYLYCTQIK